jgi:predicted ATP-grasp superfamily ATP-dependent carboligase
MIPTDKTVIYVTREIERALGMLPHKNYLIVSNKTSYGETIRSQFPEFITLIENEKSGELMGTTELLNHEITQKLIRDSAAIEPTAVLVFKNTLRVESMISAHGWQVLNPKSALSERVENKLSQIRWLGPIGAKYLPPHASKLAKHIVWKNDPFIIQWAHGHTGDGTQLIRTREELAVVQEKFPERMARLSTFITGPSFTVNAIVAHDRILISSPSYQITGLAPFTDNQFTTVGNDWNLAQKLLTAIDIKTIENLAKEIGIQLQSEGWRGLYGVDVILDQANKRIYLIEVNARQPASTTFESELQSALREKGAHGLTTFEAHLRALLDLPIDQDLIPVKDGAQIVQRVTKNVQSVFDEAAGSLELLGYDVVSYQNIAPNSDLLRVQAAQGIMEDHNILNARGKEITETIKSSGFNIQV